MRSPRSIPGAVTWVLSALFLLSPGILPGSGFGRLYAQFQRVRRPSIIPNDTPPPSTPANPQTSASQKPAQPAAQPPAPAQPLPPSMLNQPAKPAEIRFTAASLSIRADNSSLSQILHAISTESGMKLEGLGGDERVFGNFGPGNPRDVLSDLLNGTPYNVLMVGDLSNGAPRQLILTPAGTSAENSPPVAPVANRDEDAGEENGPVNPNPQAIRTPQQMFQELQQLRERQQAVSH